MQSVKELARHPSPGTRPQPIVFHDGTLWMGAWDTDHLYAIDPHSWKVLEEIPAPGKPYGLAAIGGALRVVVSIGDEDDRYLYRFVPGKGFDSASKTACPELTGSHLVSDGKTLYLGQMGNRRVLALDSSGAVQREIPLPTRTAGFGFANDAFYLITGDDELENLHLATFDLRLEKPVVSTLATIPFDARCLAHDGKAWWTSHREASEIVSFTV